MSKRKVSYLTFLFAFAIILWFVPHSEKITDQAWHLFAIFTTTILGIILQPLPMGAITIISISSLLITKTLNISQALSGFQAPIVWLVLISFSIAKGLIKTGLGARIAYTFVRFFGKSPIGLGYGLLLTDFLLSPAIPSVTARSGGIVFPVVESLAKSFDKPHLKRNPIGAYLIQVAYQGSVITSAMFLTAMAGNPLIAAFSQNIGISLTWGKWAIAAFIPGVLSLLVLPIIIFKISPPDIKHSPEVVESAKKVLKDMGPLKRNEKIILGIFVLLLMLWSLGDFFGVNATVAALIGISLILIFNILEWKEIASNAVAWETFIWFASLITMASFLNQFGFTPEIGAFFTQILGSISWMISFPILLLIYFYSHYFFAGNTSHIGAMLPVFLAIFVSMGTPPMLAVLSLAFSSNLCGGLTHYGSGPAPLFYSAGFLTVKKWWRTGLITSFVNLIIWVGLGSLWWWALGFLK